MIAEQPELLEANSPSRQADTRPDATGRIRTNGCLAGDGQSPKKTPTAQPRTGSPLSSNSPRSRTTATATGKGRSEGNGEGLVQEGMAKGGIREENLSAPLPQPCAAFEHEQDHSDMVRLIAGCDDALESLMQRHVTRLVSQLMRMLRNPTEARECVEEAFVRVYQHRHTFHLDAKFSTWLYVIAFNLARDRLRRQARRPEFVSLEAHDEQEVGDLEEILVDLEWPPDQAMENQEWSRALTEAVASLPDTLRQPLVLFAEEDKSHAEIAAEMHCTAKAVEMRLYHARKCLHSILENEFKEHEGFCCLKRSSS